MSVIKYVGEEALQELVTKMKAYTDNKEVILDNTVTQNSSNGVKSSGIYSALAGKQDTLVSGTNIKTVNGVSLLGSGNIDANDVKEITTATNMWDLDTGIYKGNINLFYYKQGYDLGNGLSQNKTATVIIDKWTINSSTSTLYFAVSGGEVYSGTASATWGTLYALTLNATVVKTDIINNLNTARSDLPLSANMGKSLKDLIDALSSTVDGKQDVLEFDTTPTNGSTNPVTSDGVYDALVLKADKSGAVGSFVLSIDSTTYVITLQAKDVNGNNLGNAQTIDLPLESVVVSGSYDSATQKVILTLKDGSTIDFSVADLISGLQTEITSTNKLSADLVDDTSTTNKFVTATEKTTWNGKQNAITNASKLSADLVDDTSTTHKFVTASDKTTWNGKQDAMTAITTAEVDALFS